MIVAGTGHRPEKLSTAQHRGYSIEARQLLESFVESIVRELRPSFVVSGMAQGYDMALAEAAVRCGVPFTAAIPFGGQEAQWPQEARERYAALLKKAHTIKLVTEGGYAAWKFQRRNEVLVHSCDLLIALWDGGDGGTTNCIRYAEKIGRKMESMADAIVSASRVTTGDRISTGGLTNIWPQWLAVSA
jgi:uncharacterized phage-like protein YoqJ